MNGWSSALLAWDERRRWVGWLTRKPGLIDRDVCMGWACEHVMAYCMCSYVLYLFLANEPWISLTGTLTGLPTRATIRRNTDSEPGVPETAFPERDLRDLQAFFCLTSLDLVILASSCTIAVWYWTIPHFGPDPAVRSNAVLRRMRCETTIQPSFRIL